MQQQSWIFIILLVTFVQDVICRSSDSENRTFIDTEFCINYYPYTYSKCLQICSTTLDPTCLDDQLCFCNFTKTDEIQNENQKFETMTKFGVEDISKCMDSYFCETTCTNAGEDFPGMNFSRGILCSSKTSDYYKTSVNSCVCSL